MQCMLRQTKNNKRINVNFPQCSGLYEVVSTKISGLTDYEASLQLRKVCSIVIGNKL